MNSASASSRKLPPATSRAAGRVSLKKRELSCVLGNSSGLKSQNGLKVIRKKTKKGLKVERSMECFQSKSLMLVLMKLDRWRRVAEEEPLRGATARRVSCAERGFPCFEILDTQQDRNYFIRMSIVCKINLPPRFCNSSAVICSQSNSLLATGCVLLKEMLLI